MAAPGLTDLVAGLEGWDATVNDNNDVLRGPLPIKVYSSLSSLLALTPGSYDNCIALVFENGAMTLWGSDTNGWKPLGDGVVKESFLAHTGTVSETEVGDYDVPANLFYDGCVLRCEVWLDGLDQTNAAATLRAKYTSDVGGAPSTTTHKTVTFGTTDEGLYAVLELALQEVAQNKACLFWREFKNATAACDAVEDIDWDETEVNGVSLTLQLGNTGDTVRVRTRFSLLMPNKS